VEQFKTAETGRKRWKDRFKKSELKACVGEEIKFVFADRTIEPLRNVG